MNLMQIDVTGSKIIGDITQLGEIGPKHHAIVLGKNPSNDQIYVAENMHTGYQIATFDDFLARYSANGNITIEPNSGNFTDIEVAQRAIDEIIQGDKGVYNLIANNCESFTNRAMHNKSTSQQVVNTMLGIAILVGTIWIIRKINK